MWQKVHWSTQKGAQPPTFSANIRAMFLLLLLLVLAALGSYFFPEASGIVIFGGAFACVAAFRLLLALAGRKKKPENDTA